MLSPEAFSDNHLLARMALRDASALATLYDRHAPVVMGLAMALTGDKTAAESVVAETFWRVWQAATNGRRPYPPICQWLLHLAFTLAQQPDSGVME